MALHFGERFGRVHHRETAALLHLLDLLEDLDQFVGLVTDQAGIAETQIARSQVGQRIAERAAFETQLSQEIRQLVVIIDQLAGRDAGGGLNAELVRKLRWRA